MFLLFIPIGILVDVSEKIDKFKEHDLSFNLKYLNTIQILFGIMVIFYFQFLFFYLLFGLLQNLSSNSEVIAILSSGISFNRYLQPFI